MVPVRSLTGYSRDGLMKGRWGELDNGDMTAPCLPGRPPERPIRSDRHLSRSPDHQRRAVSEWKDYLATVSGSMGLGILCFSFV
jgi:hypothetical protein